MNLTIDQAVILNQKGKRIPMERVKEGLVVDVAGTIVNKNKKHFIYTSVIREEGSFFLKEGQKVIIKPKAAIPV